MLRFATFAAVVVLIVGTSCAYADEDASVQMTERTTLLVELQEKFIMCEHAQTIQDIIASRLSGEPTEKVIEDAHRCRMLRNPIRGFATLSRTYTHGAYAYPIIRIVLLPEFAEDKKRSKPFYGLYTPNDVKLVTATQ